MSRCRLWRVIEILLVAGDKDPNWFFSVAPWWTAVGTHIQNYGNDGELWFCEGGRTRGTMRLKSSGPYILIIIFYYWISITLLFLVNIYKYNIFIINTFQNVIFIFIFYLPVKSWMPFLGTKIKSSKLRASPIVNYYCRFFIWLPNIILLEFFFNHLIYNNIEPTRVNIYYH